MTKAMPLPAGTFPKKSSSASSPRDRGAARARALEALERGGFPQPQEVFRAYPHQLSGGMRQLAMLAMAVVGWELFKRLNLYSGLGMGLINLYAASTLSRDFVFGGFLLTYLGLLLAFLWIADAEDGVKDNPVVLKRRLPAGDLSRITHCALRFTFHVSRLTHCDR